MKNLIFTLILLLSYNLSAEILPEQKINALVKIHRNDNGLFLHISDKHEQVPAVPANENLKKEIESLMAGDEVMVEGHLHQEFIQTGDAQKFRTFLIIDSIYKVSLRELGNIGTNIDDNFKLYPRLESEAYPLRTIPVTTEVASAITMTTGLMLMENLTSSSSADPEGRRQMRQALFLSAGTMATILFVYEQIKGKTKP